MTREQQEAIKRLIEMNAEILSKAIPTGVIMVDDIPMFKYNKTTTTLLKDITDMKYNVLNKRSDHGSKSK